MLASQDFRTIADAMAASVLDACRAHAIVFSFETGQSGRRCVLGYRAAPHDELLAALETFSREKAGHRLAFEPGGIRLHHPTGGGEHIFVILPLDADAHGYGTLALAISRSNWSEQRAFAACAQVARLVSMNLSAAHTRSKLEHDLEMLSRRTEKLQRQSEIDPLTGLENKASFEARAAARLAQSGRAEALIVFDLDFFKEVNDIYGHLFGDSYLRTIARAIRSALPTTALVGRVGGDEFAALIALPEYGESYLKGLITRLRSTVQRNIALLGKPDLGQLSIGCAVFPEQAREFKTLFGLADSALYRSKNAGRNTTSFYGEGVRAAPAMLRADGKIPDLSANVRAGFQPMIDLARGTCTGLEVLARSATAAPGSGTAGIAWMFDDYTIAPHLTRHMLREALKTLARLPAALRPDLWVNLTKFDLLDAEFAFDLQLLLDTYGFGWERIVVEVHEDVILSERGGQTYHSLQEIRRRGGRVALDDFGMGYAGLAHLRDWPIDVIKIDRTFIKGVDSDPHAKVVIEALLMIARSRGLDVVAEGIETEAQAAALRALGCGFGQGFLFDPALPAEALERRLEAFAQAAAPVVPA